MFGFVMTLLLSMNIEKKKLNLISKRNVNKNYSKFNIFEKFIYYINYLERYTCSLMPC